jgi:hypothetical protein
LIVLDMATEKCLKCGHEADLPQGHRLQVCPACGAVQSEVASSISAAQEREKRVRYGAYGQFAPRKVVDVALSNHLIEYGQTSWQVKNVAATSVTEDEIAFDVACPAFTLPAPSLVARFTIFVVGALFTLSVGLALVWLIYFALLIWAVITYRSELAKWEAAKKSVEQRRKFWETLNQNPFKFFAVSLHTNAGVDPLFFALDRTEMERISGAIKDAMSRDSEFARVVSVEILDLDIAAKSARNPQDAMKLLVNAIGLRFIEHSVSQSNAASA